MKRFFASILAIICIVFMMSNSVVFADGETYNYNETLKVIHGTDSTVISGATIKIWVGDHSWIDTDFNITDSPTKVFNGEGTIKWDFDTIGDGHMYIIEITLPDGYYLMSYDADGNPQNINSWRIGIDKQASIDNYKPYEDPNVTFWPVFTSEEISEIRNQYQYIDVANMNSEGLNSTIVLELDNITKDTPGIMISVGNDNGVTLSKDTIDKIKDKKLGIEIEVTKTQDQGRVGFWKIREITNATDFNPAFTVGESHKGIDDRLKQAGVLDENYANVSFKHSGVLPGKAKVLFWDLKEFISTKSGQKLFLYYFNPTSELFTLITTSTSEVVDGNVTSEFSDITHCSDYVITTSELPTTIVAKDDVTPSSSSSSNSSSSSSSGKKSPDSSESTNGFILLIMGLAAFTVAGATLSKNRYTK